MINIITEYPIPSLWIVVLVLVGYFTIKEHLSKKGR